jgi:hypothetical protein
VSITREQRDLIRERASNCCEYCRVAQDDRLSKFQIDHVIPVKHGGSDDTNNLCLACLKCNGYKGPNVAALDPVTSEATKLYDPRHQQWNEHFEINADATLTGLSPEGRATILVLRINEEGRVKQRQMSMMLGEYPCQSD